MLGEHRNFRIFWIGQTLSLMGTWIQVMGEGWLALELTNNAFLVTLVSAVGALPVLALSMQAGVVADRFDKLKIVRTMQALMLLEAITLWAVTISGHVNIHWLLGLAALSGIFSAFEIPARQAMMIELVGREDLAGAIALNSSGFNLARIVGPALGALVIGTLGLAWCFGFNALSYLAVLVGLSMITRPGGAVVERKSATVRHAVREIRQEIGEGLRYIGRTSPINQLMLLVVVFSVGSVPYLALMPVMARDVLGLGPGGYGGLLTAVGVGGLAGALFVASVGQRIPRGRLLRVSSLALPVILIAFSFVERPLLAYPVLLLAGAMMILNSALANGILQSLVDDAYRGRLMAVYSFVVVGLGEVVGSGLSGPIADRVGADWTIRGAAILMGAYVAWAYWRRRELRKL